MNKSPYKKDSPKCEICGFAKKQVYYRKQFNKFLCPMDLAYLKKYGIPKKDALPYSRHVNHYEFLKDYIIVKIVRNNQVYDCKIDFDDYDKIKDHKWSSTGTGYVRTTINGKCMSMQQFLLGKVEGMFIDHINHDRMDNRRNNLRRATRQQNRIHSKPQNDTRQKGVHKHRYKYAVVFNLNGKIRSYGTFDKVEDAVKKAKEIELELHGKFRYDSKKDVRNI